MPQSLRLNLPRYRCLLFEVFGEFTCGWDQDSEIQAFMRQTHTHQPASNSDDDGIDLDSIFGSLSKIGGSSYPMQARITRQPQEDGIRVTVSMYLSGRPRALPRPPRDFKPVSSFVDGISRLAGTQKFNCRAEFEYNIETGFTSKVVLPLPLVLQGTPQGITHIERAQFSCRLADGVAYRVAVSTRESDASFRHIVDFEEETELNRDSLSRMLRKAVQISSLLLVKE